MVFCLHTVVSGFVLVCVRENFFFICLFSFFLREQERRSWGSGNNLGGFGWGEYDQKIYCMEKFIFNKREKWLVIKTIKQCQILLPAELNSENISFVV